MQGFIWFDNYINFFNDPKFWNTLKISLIYAGLTVVLELLLGLAIALLLQKRSRINNFISILLLLAADDRAGAGRADVEADDQPEFRNSELPRILIGFPDMKWGSDPATALFTVVLVDMWVYTPFMMILLLAGLRSLPTAPFEAAALDGVPRSFVFFRITLPMLMPYLLTATLFRLLDSIQQFDIIYAMTQGGPGDKLLVFQVQAYLDFFQATNVGRSAALMIILWAITYFLSNIFIKQWLKLREKAHGARLMDHTSTLERSSAACCWRSSFSSSCFRSSGSCSCRSRRMSRSCACRHPSFSRRPSIIT